MRDKVAQILGMIQDNDTMQQERLKARRLKKKFATTKSVGSAPLHHQLLLLALFSRLVLQ